MNWTKIKAPKFCDFLTQKTNQFSQMHLLLLSLQLTKVFLCMVNIYIFDNVRGGSQKDRMEFFLHDKVLAEINLSRKYHLYVFNRPGVAEAVLQTALSLID